MEKNDFPAFSTLSNTMEMKAEALSKYDHFVCLTASSRSYFYQPIVISLPLNLAEESPAISINLQNVEENAISFKVTATIPCYVWCTVNKADEKVPSVDEMKRNPMQFVRNKKALVINHLISDTKYDLFCYAESKLGSPMEESIESTLQPFTTAKSIFTHSLSHSLSHSLTHSLTHSLLKTNSLTLEN